MFISEHLDFFTNGKEAPVFIRTTGRFKISKCAQGPAHVISDFSTYTGSLQQQQQQQQQKQMGHFSGLDVNVFIIRPLQH